MYYYLLNYSSIEESFALKMYRKSKHTFHVHCIFYESDAVQELITRHRAQSMT